MTTLATYYSSSGRGTNRTQLRPVPHPNKKSPSTSSIMSISTSPAPAPSPRKLKTVVDSWQRQRRPASFVGPETSADVGDLFRSSLATSRFSIPPRPWASPEASPLLPPPRGNSVQPRSSTGLLIVLPPSTSPVEVSGLQRARVSPSPAKCRAPKHHRTRTSEVLETVLGIYPSSKSRAPPGKSTADALADHLANRILSHRITIDSQTKPPRTPPPPPTPAKSRAQRERARVPPPLPTPVGFLAELEGSCPVEPAVDKVSSASIVPNHTIIANKPRKRKVKSSKIESNISLAKPKTLEGKEIYERLPLPAVPTPLEPQPMSPPPSPVVKSSESSPVIDVELEMDYADGLVKWFENFCLGEGVTSPNMDIKSPGTARTSTSTQAPRGTRTSNPNIPSLPPARVPRTPRSAKNTFSVEDRASVLDPDGAVRNGEPSLSPGPLFSPGNVANNTGLLSPVYPVSPRLVSYYGARSSSASSVGDAFRFDLEMGEALSDVDEEFEGHEIGVSKPSQLSPGRGNTGELNDGVPNERQANWELVVEQKLDVDELYGDGSINTGRNQQRTADELDIDDLYLDDEYEDGDNTSDTSSEFDSRFEQEIEMILSGTYGGGSPDDWRDGIYSAGSSSSEQSDEWEGEIMVGLDINMSMQMVGKAEGTEIEMGIDGVMGDEGWRERPRTRYIAGRNSMLDSDVIFCLRGVDIM